MIRFNALARPVRYDQQSRPLRDVDVRVAFREAGHILGSASVEIVTPESRLILSGDLAELIDGPEALLPHLPTFAPLLEDLTQQSDEALAAMQLTALSRLVLLLFKHARDGDLVARLPGPKAES